MTFNGTALEDIGKIRQAFPRDLHPCPALRAFRLGESESETGIVMGVSQDYFRILGAEDATTQWVTYENVAWRKQWMTSNWGVR